MSKVACEVQAKLLLAVYSSVIADKGAVYCSVPITSGRRLLDWLDSNGRSEFDRDLADESARREHDRLVIAANVSHAAELVERLRARFSRPVINPAAVPTLPHWTQQDWLTFWKVVIRQFADTVVFGDGWEFSSGCRQEYLFATSIGCTTLDERGRPLNDHDALELLSGAVHECDRLGVESAGLMAALDELRRRALGAESSRG